MNAATAAERYFFARASGDAALMALLRNGEPVHRIVRGLPSDTIQEADFPRLAFSVQAPRRRSARQEVLMRVDILVWPDGEHGYPARLQAIDARLEELFGDTGARYPAHAPAFTINSEDAGLHDFNQTKPTLRRTRQLLFHVTPV